MSVVVSRGFYNLASVRRIALQRSRSLCLVAALARRAVVPVVAIGCFGMTACSPQKPVVTPTAIRVTQVSTSGMLLDVQLDVQNPNSFPLMAHRVDGSVALSNGATLGSGSAQPQGSIPANGRSTVTTQLNVPWQNIAALAPFALSANPVPYTFKGEAMLGGESLNVKIPFELQGQLTRAQILDAGLRGF